MIIGSKSLDQKLIFKFLSKIFDLGSQFVLRLIFNSPVTDTHGLKIINVKKAKNYKKL